MPARRFIMLVKESSYGVPKASPVLGVDKIYLRLGDGSDIQLDPIVQETPHGGGETTAACAWSDQQRHEGTLATLLYPEQAEFLLNWWLTKVDQARTKPWATTDPNGKSPPGDLGSVSVYDAIQELDGTFTRTAHRGTKVDSGTLVASAEGEARAWRLSLTLKSGAVQTVNSTEFPAPSESDYPCNPFVLSHVAGKFKIGVDRDEIDNITLTSNNKLVEKWFESQFPLRTNTYGRDVTLALDIVRKTTPDDYTAYKSVVAHDAEFTLDNGEVTAKIDLHGNNHWATLAKRLPDGDIYGWQATLKNKIDAGAGADLTVTVADVEEEEEEG